jgi:hypothetical protein
MAVDFPALNAWRLGMPLAHGKNRSADYCGSTADATAQIANDVLVSAYKECGSHPRHFQG